MGGGTKILPPITLIVISNGFKEEIKPKRRCKMNENEKRLRKVLAEVKAGWLEQGCKTAMEAVRRYLAGMEAKDAKDYWDTSEFMDLFLAWMKPKSRRWSELTQEVVDMFPDSWEDELRKFYHVNEEVNDGNEKDDK
jgi:hypothetical protein